MDTPAITKETIAEMREEGLDILVEFWRRNPDARVHEAVKHYSKEWGDLIGMPGTPILPHPYMMVVARELAKKETP